MSMRDGTGRSEGIYAVVEIAAPVESVFEKYAQYDRHPEWQPGLLRATLVSDGPVRVDARVGGAPLVWT